MPNLQKWVNLSFLLCGILIGFIFREIFGALFDYFGWLRVDWALSPADLGGVLVGLIVFVGLARFGKARDYLGEVFVEMGKVSWPNRKETMISTGVVAVLLGICSLCVVFFDTVWLWVTDKLLY